MLLDGAEGLDHAALRAAFRWRIPQNFNIASACCDRHALADPQRPALLGWRPDGSLAPTSFGTLKTGSERLGHALLARGIAAGDRVAILLPQSPETVIAHLAVYRIGAIAVPLAALFGVDALEHRLADSGAKAIVTDAAGLARLGPIRGRLPMLERLFSVDGDDGAAEDLRRILATPAAPLAPLPSGPDDPALMIYTSGTTGLAKGALHGHRVLAGHLPGFAFTHRGIGAADDVMWTPADWAWAGGLLNALLPALFFGVPVVHGPFARFDPEGAFRLMAEARVSRAFLPPTALRMMRSVEAPRRFALALGTVGAAGEALGAETFEQASAALGLPVDEFYGQTECNYVLGSSAARGVSRPGTIGKALPGHEVVLLDADGAPVPAGTPGEIAVRAPDPVMFLGYWNAPAATAAKFRGPFMLTGDQGVADADGYIRFLGRTDDVITSAGYRIGPGEIEECLITHPAVALAAAVGKPDPLRTEIVKAYVVLKPGFAPSDELAQAIRSHVRARLSAHDYPREIAFVDEMPLTTSGKVIRRIFRDRAAAEASPPGAAAV